MSKLDRIRHFLNENKAGLAIVSDPVTVNYLTGFDCDPHERQMFLFVYENREPALFVPALEVARASAVLDFPVFGYVDSENPWQKIKAGLASTDSSIIYAEFDNLNVTKFQGLQTVFEGRFENLTPFIQKMRVIKSADEIQKMIVAGDYADKAVNIGFDNISLDVTETDIIAQIEFGIKRLGYEMSFETMVLT
ncbi:MAG: M24 family metallopeptidase, partial [Streptococcus salivarius]